MSIMKTQSTIRFNLIILMSFFILMLNGCSEDNDDFSIIGSWNVDRFVLYNHDGDHETETLHNFGTKIFNENGSGVFHEGEIVHDFSWMLSDKVMTMTLTGSGRTVVFDLIIHNNDNIILETERPNDAEGTQIETFHLSRL